MWSVCKKELRQFFSSLTGYIAIVVFLLVNGLVLFVFRNNILENGYATLDDFFRLAPWVLIFLVPAITMRAFADEYRGGTFEVLRTRPLTAGQVVRGKFWGSFIVALIALLPTLVYYSTINSLAATTGIDAGAAAGAYLGLLFLTAVFTSIGIYLSSTTTNPVVAFIFSALALAILYYGFTAISQLPVFESGWDYLIELIGIESHYRSISRGVVDTRDLIYFISLVFFFLWITQQTIAKRT
jgi:ABC-2 type transport system permease protein